MWLRNFFCLYAGCWDVIAPYGGVWIRQREKDWRTSPSLNSFSPIIPRTSLLNACVLKCVNGRQNPWPVVDRKRSQNLVVRARFSSTLGLEVGVSDCVTRRRRIVNLQGTNGLLLTLFFVLRQKRIKIYRIQTYKPHFTLQWRGSTLR